MTDLGRVLISSRLEQTQYNRGLHLATVYCCMPKRITIAPHLSQEELESRYRQAKDPIERSHYQIIWLLACGRPTEEVAAITSYSRHWIYELVWGYNRVGPETLGDGRHQNSNSHFE